jgi:hypothetical protein
MFVPVPVIPEAEAQFIEIVPSDGFACTWAKGDAGGGVRGVMAALRPALLRRRFGSAPHLSQT